MTWRPTLKQLETIADMDTARLPPAAMAAAVGLSLDAFIGWRRRSMAAARAEDERYAKPDPILEPKPVVPAPVSLRIVAERLFEGDPATEGMPQR
jgi:hypothetical protein